jgi:hypothetical protein
MHLCIYSYLSDVTETESKTIRFVFAESAIISRDKIHKFV